MSALVNAVLNQLDEEEIPHLFLNSDQENDRNKLLGDKVHAMAQKLKLLPYTKSNQFKSGRVQPISHNKIKPVHLLCPTTFTCTSATCNPHSLVQLTRSLLSPTVSDRKLAFPSGSERFCSETLISARNAASVKSEPIFEIARNFSEHIPINSEQLVGITRI